MSKRKKKQTPSARQLANLKGVPKHLLSRACLEVAVQAIPKFKNKTKSTQYLEQQQRMAAALQEEEQLEHDIACVSVTIGHGYEVEHKPTIEIKKKPETPPQPLPLTLESVFAEFKQISSRKCNKCGEVTPSFKRGFQSVVVCIDTEKCAERTEKMARAITDNR